MQARRIRWMTLCLLALALASVLFVGCQPMGRRSDRANDDWSRGERLGQAAVNGPVALASAPEGEAIYLAWVAATDAKSAQPLHLVRLNRAGEVMVERDLAISTQSPADIGLVVGEGNQIHLFWIDRLGNDRRLFYAQVDQAGELVVYPRPLSPEGLSADSYDADLTPTGGLEVFWGAQEGEHPGLYHLCLTARGEVAADNLLLIPGGFDPTFRRARDGTTHLVWYARPAYGEYHLWYATFDAAARQITHSADLARFSAGTGLVAHRPTIGLAGSDAYVFWSLERRGGGLSAPGAKSYWVAFPLGQPEGATPQEQVILPAANHPEYGQLHTVYNVRELADAQGGGFPASLVYSAATPRAHEDQLAVAFMVQLRGRTREILQPLLTVWDKGQIEGYQIAAKTNSGSLQPTLLADRGDLHLAWIDTGGFGRYDVYYASTTPEARANLNRLSGQDVLSWVAGVLWAMAQAVGFIPLTFMWLLAPVIILAIYLFITVEPDLARRGPRVMLAVVILVYLLFKYLTGRYWLGALELPGFSADFAMMLGLLTPLVVGGIACLVTWLLMRRREYASLIQAFAIFAASDALLTLLIYIPGIMVE